jgi:hypothetical protein
MVSGDSAADLIIVTAPHATMPFLEGQYRFADGEGTAALAKLPNELPRATVVFTVFESPSDPNYHDNSVGDLPQS